MPVEMTCRLCGRRFSARSNRCAYCSPECKRQGKRETNRVYQLRRQAKAARQAGRRSSPKWSFAEITAWIQRHYEETGELLSYGKAVCRLEREPVTGDRT